MRMGTGRCETNEARRENTGSWYSRGDKPESWEGGKKIKEKRLKRKVTARAFDLTFLLIPRRTFLLAATAAPVGLAALTGGIASFLFHL
jgi:hypothetical protein